VTKPLQQPNVQISPKRLGPPRLTAPERQALDSVPDAALRKVLGEIFLSSRGVQENFDQISQWFPIQPQDTADAIPTLEELQEGALGLEEVMGVIVHGENKKTPRGEHFPVYTWIGSVEPENMFEFDIWIDTS
jgi:hypothetical protein